MQRKLTRLHFVGIGGIGMAALAELLHAQGCSVSGSDLVAGATVERLRELGIPVVLGHDADAIGAAQAIVRSTAIPDENPELAAARSAGLPIVGRGELLAEVMRTKDAVAIAGSHGKTTTSAMTGHVLEQAGLDPTSLVGGRVPRPGGFASPTKPGHGDLMVAEVDESDGSFLATRPVVAVITNVDPEHLDHYGDYESLLDAFVRFGSSVPFWGAAVLGIDHPGVMRIAPRIDRPRTTFGFSAEADVRGARVEPVPGGQRCEVELASGGGFAVELPLPGRHNVQNALAAIAVARELDVSTDVIADALASFPGVARRFERKGETGGIEIVDDYAHHPAEIRATLAGARAIHDGRITAIFQPHRYTRTRDLWDAFLACFEQADRVVVSSVYSAGEAAIEGIDGEALAAAIARTGHADARFGGSLDRIAEQLPGELRSGDLVLTLGAGDVVRIGPLLLQALRSGREGRA